MTEAPPATLAIFTVYGIPAPQGSKRPVRLGKGPTARIGMVESSTKVGPWRAAVKAAALLHMPAPMTGPVSVSLTFYLPRPGRPQHPVYPVTMPDLDKLVRSTLDGLAEGAAVGNDSQVCQIVTSKLYATGDNAPGCVVTLRAMGAE